MPARISINRAPVLTLWATVVAQRLGFRWHLSLSLGVPPAPHTTSGISADVQVVAA